MSEFKLSQRSLDRLNGVHPDLVAVVKHAIEITPLDFGITKGLRDRVRQEKLVASGASTTMNSRHLTGHAVDIVIYYEGEVTWHGGHYDRVWREAFEPAARELGIPITWGGNFKSFFDGPHFELTWEDYPADKLEA